MIEYHKHEGVFDSEGRLLNHRIKVRHTNYIAKLAHYHQLHIDELKAEVKILQERISKLARRCH